jgi:uncharacterized protein (TIGR00290 family)
MKKIIISWSGGKDSARALYELKTNPNYKAYQAVGLLTTIVESNHQISLHDIPMSWVEAQAKSIGLPWYKVFIPKNNAILYAERISAMLLELKAKEKIMGVVFGDIFLEDLRKEREIKLASIGLKGIFPLWQKNTEMLAREFIQRGFSAVITSVDKKKINEKYIGRNFDEDFINKLLSMQTVDPCGENGEFHSFVYDAPLFKWRIIKPPVPF